MKKLIAAAALLAGSAALAQTPPPVAVTPPAPPAPMAHPMHDRVTTRAETVAMVRDHFGKLDANKDGAITTAEIAEGRAAFAGRFKDFAGRGPHVMRLEREPGDANAAFDRLDANKDGTVSRDEFVNAREQRIERRIVKREERKERVKQRREGAGDGKDVRRHVMRMHGGRGLGGARMIVMADTDKDGRITLAEAEALALQHFDRLDANRDGQVTPEERRAGRPLIIKQRIEEKKTAG